jgi:hypothetical protein
MSEMKTRRDFMKLAFGVSGLALLAPNILMAEERRRSKPAGGAAGASGAGAAGGDLNAPMVKPGEGMAASVNYQFKHEDVKDPALKVERQGVPFKDQHCKTCMLYTKAGMKNGEEVGKCTLFNGQLVKANAWCASWSKKA